MSDSVQPKPEGYSNVTAYLIVNDAQKAIDYYGRVFGAEEIFRLQTEDGAIGHAEIQIGDAKVMLADEVPEMNIKSPATIGGSSVGLLIYVENADTVFEKALSEGAVEFKPMCDQFYGDRAGTFDDPFGHRWTVASRLENISHDEVKKRFEDMMSGQIEIS